MLFFLEVVALVALSISYGYLVGRRTGRRAERWHWQRFIAETWPEPGRR